MLELSLSYFTFAPTLTPCKTQRGRVFNLEQENAKPTGKYHMKSRYYNIIPFVFSLVAPHVEHIQMLETNK